MARWQGLGLIVALLSVSAGACEALMSLLIAYDGLRTLKWDNPALQLRMALHLPIQLLAPCTASFSW